VRRLGPPLPRLWGASWITFELRFSCLTAQEFISQRGGHKTVLPTARRGTRNRRSYRKKRLKKGIHADFQEYNISSYVFLSSSVLKHYSNIRIFDGVAWWETPLSHCTRVGGRSGVRGGSVTPHRSPGGALFPSAVDRRRGPKGDAAKGPPRDDIRPPAIRRVALKRSTKNAHGGGVHDVCDTLLLWRARPRHRRCNSRKGSRPRVPRDYRNGVAAAAAEIKLR